MVDAWVTKALPSIRAVGDPVPPSNDVNLLSTAVTEVQNAGLIRKIDADSYYARVNTPVRLVFSDTQPATLAADEYWFDTSGDAAIGDEGDYFSDRRTSTCSTMPVQLADSTISITSGSLVAALAVCKETKTYTQMRMYFGVVDSAPSFAGMGIWSTAGTLLATTGAITPVANSIVTANLTASLPLSTGTQVYLGFGINGGTNVHIGKRTLLTSAMSSLSTPALTRTNGGVGAAGPLNNMSSPTNAFTTPWIELL